jgi:N utilization substance protein B
VGQRRRARECALQILFQVDLTGDPLDGVLKRFWQGLEIDDRPRAFAEQLVQGVVSGRDAIDQRISEAAERWRIDRMPIVDRNVLRMAVHEVLAGETPSAVVIDEAIEIARRFGGEGSGSFVNGLLDAIAGRIERERRGAEV